MKLNKKILTSLSVITLALVAVVAGTSAYFSDTETSTDNTFTAGAIDLKIDSYAHYNGLECIADRWQECEDPDTSNNLIDNGSFETPEVENAADWEIFSSIPDWTIEWAVPGADTYGDAIRPEPALQEYHEGVNGWTTPYGDQYAELDSDWDGPGAPLNNEPALVKISQNIDTEVGKTYTIVYAFSPRPGTGTLDNEIEVLVNDISVDNQSANGVGNTNTVWQDYSKTFVATSTSTKITFKGAGTNNSLGVFLDNVRVHPMVCTPSTEFTAPCEGTWNLTNLGPQSPKFFNFQDIKPGDYGENTISLHVDDNDAYACMMFSDLQDDDVTLTEPEEETGDDDTVGELSANMYMFAWRDNGNNIWEEGEDPIFSENAAPQLASDVLNSKIYPLATPSTEPLPGGGTEYIGLAWCAGTMTFNGYDILCDGKAMGNDAQTDAMSVDVTFYVEQARHNSAFTCDGLLTKEEPTDI